MERGNLPTRGDCGYRLLGRSGNPDGDSYHFSTALEHGASFLWDESTPGLIPVEDRVHRIRQLEGKEWIEVFVLREMAMSDAISKGKDLAPEIGDHLSHLLPFYRLAVGIEEG